MNQDVTDTGNYVNPLNPSAGFFPYSAVSKADWANQFYGEYTVGKLRIDSEYRRFLHDQIVNGGTVETITDVRGWYVSGAYRLTKRLAFGSYYSHYSITSVAGGLLAFMVPTETDTNLPANHIDDRAVSMRIDLNRFWNAKVEGHFMDGYGNSTYPDGFYPQLNTQGFKTDTNALVLKTSVSF